MKKSGGFTRRKWLIAAPAVSAATFRLGNSQPLAVEGKNTKSEKAQRATAGKKYTLENCVREFSEAGAEKTKQGWQFWFVPTELSPTFNLKVTQVGPQSANHPAHAHPEEEIYYVLEGKAEFTLDGKTRAVGANATMFCPSGIPHGIRNVGDAPLRYAVIKANYPN